MSNCELINPVNDEVYVSYINIADSWFSRLVGLLDKSGLNSQEGLLIQPCRSIHTIGMRFSIDVVFVGKDNKIMKIKKGLKPFRFCFSSLRTHYVLELSTGTVDRCKLECGNILAFRK